MTALLPVLLVMVLTITELYLTSQPADAGKVSLITIGLYSETSDGYISYRVGTGNRTVIKVGDAIPDNAEISVTVQRDWIELSPSNNSNAVYEIFRKRLHATPNIQQWNITNIGCLLTCLHPESWFSHNYI
jgi:hypothetical protein